MGSKPIGSSLLKKGTKKKGGHLNMVAPTGNLFDAATVVNGGEFGAGTIETFGKDTGGGGGTYLGGATNQPQPMTAPVATTTQPEVVNPPYSYEDTNAADCPTLGGMIANVQNILLYARLTQEGYNVYNKWLSYATDRFNTSCNIKNLSPTMTDGPVISVDVPPVVMSDPGMPVDTTKMPTTDDPHLSTTVQPPATTPYNMSAGGGGGGSEAAPSSTKRKGILLLAAALVIAGAFIHSKA